MSDYDLKPQDLINARERFNVPKPFEPVIDEVISKIVGKKICQRDPRLIKLIVKWRKEKLGRALDSMTPDNFLEKPAFIQELREVLSKPL